MNRHRWVVGPAALLALGLGVAIAGLPSRHTDGPLPVSAGDESEISASTTVPRPASPTASSSTTVPAAPRFDGKVLVIGSSGDSVLVWQRRMKERGWDVTPDGKFGAGSSAMARSFQKQKGLRVTGEVDSSTWAAAWTAPLPDDTATPNA